MKNNIQFLVLFALSTVFTFTACQKDAEDTAPVQNNEVMSDKEAAATSDAIVSAATQEVVEFADSAADGFNAEEADNRVNYCDMTYDTTLTWSASYGTASGEYTSSWAWTVICNNLQVPIELDMTTQADGNFASLLVEGNMTSEGTYSLTGLLPTDASYVVNGTYTASGTISSKVRLQNTFTFEATLHINELSISKNNFTIESGGGDITLVATSSNGQSATVTGTLTFNGDGTATLEINGQTYTIHL
ncbi:MAG: hypothetical protein ACE5FF_07770 [Saprospiraceae bacterium]